MHKIFELYKLTHQYIKQFPKQEKYSLGQKIENLILDIFELTFKALNCSKNEKLLIVQNISNKIDLLKILIRLCNDVQIIDQKKYINIEEKLQEIGKMVGGWMKSLA